MNIIHKFLVGSSAIFEGLEGFCPKDRDVLCIVDYYPFGGKGINMRVHLGGDDVFLCKNVSKEVFIQDMIEAEVPMKISRFLSPEFAKYLNLTIDELKQFAHVIPKLDDKHKYLGLVWQFYIDNNSFTLTDEQRKQAFQLYKEARA